jgi:hypothetical protein
VEALNSIQQVGVIAIRQVSLRFGEFLRKFSEAGNQVVSVFGQYANRFLDVKLEVRKPNFAFQAGTVSYVSNI